MEIEALPKYCTEELPVRIFACERAIVNAQRTSGFDHSIRTDLQQHEQ